MQEGKMNKKLIFGMGLIVLFLSAIVVFSVELIQEPNIYDEDSSMEDVVNFPLNSMDLDGSVEPIDDIVIGALRKLYTLHLELKAEIDALKQAFCSEFPENELCV